MIPAGAELADIEAPLGYESIATTRIYTGVGQERVVRRLLRHPAAAFPPFVAYPPPNRPKEMIFMNPSKTNSWLSLVPTWLLIVVVVYVAVLVSYAVLDNRDVEFWPPRIHPKGGAPLPSSFPSLAGIWRVTGSNLPAAGSASIGETDRSLTFRNEHGDSSAGDRKGSNGEAWEVYATDWKLKGVVTDSGNVIRWDNNTTWYKTVSP